MARKYEKSSGGIVYRKRGEKIEILLLKWLNSRGVEEFVIPKGKIEEGEVAKDAAIREINEEAGLLVNDLEIIKFITKLSYTFTAGHLDGNPVIDKDVYLFLVKYNGNIDPIVRKEERFIGYTWANIKKLDSMNVKFDISGIVFKNKTYFI